MEVDPTTPTAKKDHPIGGPVSPELPSLALTGLCVHLSGWQFGPARPPFPEQAESRRPTLNRACLGQGHLIPTPRSCPPARPREEEATGPSP